MTAEQITELRNKGYTVLKNVIPDKWVLALSAVSDALIEKYEKPKGVVLHGIAYHSIFIELLQELLDNSTVADIEHEYFNAPCILNSLSIIDNFENPKTFAINPHRDLRFYSEGFNIMLNCLVMLDPFTKENGGTYVLPGSHKLSMRPTELEWETYREQVTGNAGDMLIFNSNLFHAGAPNKTDGHRRSLPITLSRSCMKPLIDHPRLIGYNKQSMFSNELQLLLGYYSRVPASLQEWDQPEEKRMYKKFQD